ncbi:hypothetical protein LPB140_07750 [Sphingorhabdus lutea]|uniref:AAA family ATPase n=1 Tax=Sphingorhabdus lutea TaxID=1913578 RepID=A0A1L3JC43_9SPHN|nr:AAA family ATPase [Sphingorhabdus lutea]APG62701.1 hypothetical protein LPB140_07750 [Sphingorhabdus lutea]
MTSTLPHNIDESSNENWQIFAKGLHSKRLHHAWLLIGPKGVGKRDFALRAGAAYLDPNGIYQSLLENFSHPDQIILERPLAKEPEEGKKADADAERKRSINVEQIRQLQKRLLTKPGIANGRIIIIDSIDDLEKSAANALLKNLEEPQPGNIFMLISHRPEILLPTIRSRCQILKFNRLSDDELRAQLPYIVGDLPMEDWDILIKLANGSIGTAKAYYDINFMEIERKLQEMAANPNTAMQISAFLMSKLSLKAEQKRYENFLQRVPMLIYNKICENNGQYIEQDYLLWSNSTKLAGRAIKNSLDKKTVILQMTNYLSKMNK